MEEGKEGRWGGGEKIFILGGKGCVRVGRESVCCFVLGGTVGFCFLVLLKSSVVVNCCGSVDGCVLFGWEIGGERVVRWLRPEWG